MTRLFLIAAAVLAFVLPGCSGTALRSEHQDAQKKTSASLLPLDSAIVSGKLDNGLTYFIRRNGKPEKRVELRLAVKAGSVLEDDDQQGLAHFCEHMAFNGTKNFKKHELVDFLESIGMRFGPELNAYTSFDQTVYMLQVPADSAEVVDKAFQILEDWAHNVSYDNYEIDRERGVIVEEWRLGRGANARMRDKQFPVLFHGSRYAERLPIGSVDIIRNCSHDTLKRFYRDWYRPDLMAVVVVGDIEPAEAEKLIKTHFSRIANPGKERERIVYPVPAHNETLFALAADPEATGSDISIYWKHEVEPETTELDYRRNLVAALYNAMFNERLSELSRKADPPFLYGYSGQGRFVLSKEVYLLSADVRDNGIERGFETLLTEAARVRKFGFTASELERMKSELLRSMEQAYKERDKTESANYADEYIRHFTTDEPVPGIEYEYAMYNKYIPGITLEEVNALAAKWITDNNKVILASGPDKAGAGVPDESALKAVMDRVASKTVEPYVDAVSDEPLVSKLPKSSPVVDEKDIPELGVTEWRLANGIRIILKPTDFKNDEIVFTAYSPGGYSLVPDKDYISAVTATPVVVEGGLGSFNLTELNKKLAGKVVGVSPYISSLREGFSGNASPSDIETLFQLIYLYCTSPRKDSEAYAAFLSRIKGYIENRSARPETALQDTLSVTLTQHHYRSRPWTLPLLDELNLDRSFSIFRDRFTDTDDFTFIFVGSIDPATLKPLAEQWLGGLPVTPREETWKDNGIDYPHGVIDKTVKKGIEPKSAVAMVFTGPFKWDRKSRYILGSMTDILDIKLREVLREDAGGTYGVGVRPSMSHWPKEEYEVRISFGTDPGRVDEMTGLVMTQIDSLKTFGTTDVYLNKVKETQRREREVSLKENSFWLSILDSYYYNGEDPREILAYDELVDNLTLDDIKSAATFYFNMKNYVKVVLLPEK